VVLALLPEVGVIGGVNAGPRPRGLRRTMAVDVRSSAWHTRFPAFDPRAGDPYLGHPSPTPRVSPKPSAISTHRPLICAPALILFRHPPSSCFSVAALTCCRGSTSGSVNHGEACTLPAVPQELPSPWCLSARPRHFRASGWAVLDPSASCCGRAWAGPFAPVLHEITPPARARLAACHAHRAASLLRDGARSGGDRYADRHARPHLHGREYGPPRQTDLGGFASINDILLIAPFRS